MKITHGDIVRALELAGARGRSRAIHAPELAAMLGESYGYGEAIGNGAGQKLRKLVSAAVQMGYPICSGQEGYWIPETSAELIESADRIEARARTLLDRGAQLRARAERMMAQA